MSTYLDNGLRIILRRIENQKTLSCGIWINQGVKDEKSEENGISHLIEHLMFKIDSYYSDFSMMEATNILTDLGSKYNAATTKDYTSFYIDGLAKDFDQIIKVLASIVMSKKKLIEDILRKEKEIICREAETYFVSTSQIAERVNQALWGDMSYGQLVIGKLERINEITADQIDQLIKESYIPENAVLVVVGGIEYDDTLKKIEKIFNQWENAYKKDKNYPIQDKPGLFINSIFQGTRSTIGLGFSAYPITDIRSQYLNILKDIISAPSSKLYGILREEKGLIYSLGGFTSSYGSVGSLGLTFSASNDKICEILSICVQEIKYLLKNGVDKKDLEITKRKRETELLHMIESTSNQLQTIGNYAINGKMFSVEENLRLINKIETNHIDDIINDIFVQNNISLAVLGKADIDQILPILEF
jgi:predicted Zn-dependent peptidase